MPYPAHVSVVTVTGTWKATDGSPAAGYVTFTPNTRLQDGIDSTLIEMTPLTVLLVNGAISVQVMATDDTDLSPAGWTYAGGSSATPGKGAFLPFF